MNVPFLDLAAQYRSIAHEIDTAVRRVLASGVYVLGPELEALEREFAACCGGGHAVGVNSGTSALHLALLACGIGPGDEVLTVPMTFVATVAAIEYARATPRFVDIDPVSKTMDVARLRTAITPRTRALLPVHLHGQPCDMSPIMEVARDHGLAVIEDAAQSHLASYGNQKAGTFGRFGCFSFYPGKNIGACGEGGLVLCARAEGRGTNQTTSQLGLEPPALLREARLQLPARRNSGCHPSRETSAPSGLDGAAPGNRRALHEKPGLAAGAAAGGNARRAPRLSCLRR